MSDLLAHSELVGDRVTGGLGDVRLKFPVSEEMDEVIFKIRRLLDLGLLFVPMSLVSLSKVGNNDAGVASSLLNVGQQVGGSIGLALLGTVAWSAARVSQRLFSRRTRTSTSSAIAAGAVRRETWMASVTERPVARVEARVRTQRSIASSSATSRGLGARSR